MTALDRITPLPPGSWEELQRWVGQPLGPDGGHERLTAEAIRRHLEVLEWDCALHREPDVARWAGHAGLTGPSAMAFTLALEPYWAPGMPPRSLAEPKLYAPLPFLFLPGPGSKLVGAGYRHEVHRLPVVGDLLTSVSRLESCRRRRTRLGDGAFLEVSTEYRDEHGEPVVTGHWTLYRYEPDGDAADSPPPDAPAPPSADVTHAFTIAHDLQRLVMWAGVNRDFVPLHHDREFARSAGAPDAFANTLFVLALYERLVRERYGPRARIERLGPFRMHGFLTADSVVRVCAGAPSRIDGALVTPVWQECDGRVTSSGEAVVRPD